jgi:hypothetical protein
MENLRLIMLQQRQLPSLAEEQRPKLQMLQQQQTAQNQQPQPLAQQ